jgi:MFS transporter, OFA family, oxalate/formate antiporter
MSLASGALHGARLSPWSRPMNRWVQLVAGTVVMMGIASVLGAWPLLRSPPGADLAKSLAAAENAFAAFIVAETLFVPLEAWLGDRLHPRLLVLAGGALVLIGAAAGARVESVRAQTMWYALGGAGAGIVYGGTVARALKRFTDRKALCVGVTAAACAAVLGLALVAYLTAVRSPDAIGVLVVIGAGQAVVILVATLLILEPPPTTPLPPGA